MRISMTYLNQSFLIMLYLSYAVSVSHSSKNASITPTRVLIRCLHQQSSLLLQLKQEFEFEGSEGYPKMKTWKEGKDCCEEWDGVTCDAATGQVVRIDLSSSWLRGPLLSNSSLFRLRHLQRLNLAYNDLTGSMIPSTFGRLSRLTHLNLSWSMFSGDVPSELAWLTNLVSLDLAYNSVSLGPTGESRHLRMKDIAQNMTNLKILNLDQMDIPSSVPQSFVNLSSLTSLSLSYCSLHGQFPKHIFRLPEIQTIDLSGNTQLTGSVPEFRYGSKLELLDLGSTNFSGILPGSIGNLNSLKVLNLESSMITGTIPTSLGNLSLLTDLSLPCNIFGQLPSTLGDLSQLTRLIGEGNLINGTLPSSLGNLSQLTELSLFGKFDGQLPYTLGNLAKLKTLRLLSWGGGFTGELPSSFGNLKNLETLHLYEHNLSGQIPSLSNLSLLTSIDLHSNAFDGKFPALLTNLTHLSYVDISKNLLVGAIPSSLFSMISLNYLNLKSNSISGPLAIQNISSSQMTYLDLSNNRLNGRVPISISKLKNLSALSLGSNNLSGSISLDIFSELSELSFLELSSNSLSVMYTSGSNLTLPKFESLYLSACNINEFPEFLKAQDKLLELDLSNNQLQGEIPEWFFSIGIEMLASLNLSHNSITGWEQAPLVLPWKYLIILDLHSNSLEGSLAVLPFSTEYLFISENNLSGTINQLFCNLTAVRVFDASKNNLSGNIPECLGSVSNSLYALNLQGNNFSGKIPQTFLEGSQLRTMDLSHNHLEGKVPRSLINCKALEVLNLGHNQISDTFPFWLQNSPELQVLLLRSNKFRGPIWHPKKFSGFAKLRIIDLSFNRLDGALPPKYFKNLRAMSNAVDQRKLKYMMIEDWGDYHDSVTLMSKGNEMVFEKILTIFTSIDLSNSNFSGEVPSSIGDLQSLIVLNLSSNSFEGHIPPSLGKLTALESLDLSNNKLSGKIPQGLASLTFLQYLNLSDNRLSGSIPQSRQFDTFSNSSFGENLDLCGSPLTKKCESGNQMPTNDHSHGSELENGFGWKPVMMGYGCGFLVGAIGGFLLLSRKPSLLIRIYGTEKKRRKTKWTVLNHCF